MEDQKSEDNEEEIERLLDLSTENGLARTRANFTIGPEHSNVESSQDDSQSSLADVFQRTQWEEPGCLGHSPQPP